MAAKKLSFEEKLSRLEEIVAALEKGDAPLADSCGYLAKGPNWSTPAPRSWTRRSSRWSS